MLGGGLCGGRRGWEDREGDGDRGVVVGFFVKWQRVGETSA